MTVSQVNRIERGRIANPGYNTVKAIVERGIGASMSELEKEE